MNYSNEIISLSEKAPSQRAKQGALAVRAQGLLWGESQRDLSGLGTSEWSRWLSPQRKVHPALPMPKHVFVQADGCVSPLSLHSSIFKEKKKKNPILTYLYAGFCSCKLIGNSCKKILSGVCARKAVVSLTGVGTPVGSRGIVYYQS